MARTAPHWSAQDCCYPHGLFPMTTHARGRRAAFIALATLGGGVAFAVTDGAVVSSRSVEPQGKAYPPLDGSLESADAAQEVLGAQAGSSAGRDGGRIKSGDAK